jgi:hypothetical protein
MFCRTPKTLLQVGVFRPRFCLFPSLSLFFILNEYRTLDELGILIPASSIHPHHHHHHHHHLFLSILLGAVSCSDLDHASCEVALTHAYSGFGLSSEFSVTNKAHTSLAFGSLAHLQVFKCRGGGFKSSRCTCVCVCGGGGGRI